jgi:hypothetical protein
MEDLGERDRVPNLPEIITEEGERKKKNSPDIVEFGPLTALAFAAYNRAWPRKHLRSPTDEYHMV